MLTDHVDRYVALRQALGYGLRKPARHLHAFARFADAKGDTHIRTSTAVAWATDAPSRAPATFGCVTSFTSPASCMRRTQPTRCRQPPCSPLPRCALCLTFIHPGR